MKVTYNWLKDFVDIKIKPPVLADKLTMAGLEVTSLEEKNGDYIFEIEVTSNRPDCLSVQGIAREVAAILGHRLKVIGNRLEKKSTFHNRQYANPLSIKIEDKKDCPLYTAKIIMDVQVGPSPDWLKKRLELIGCRSINNIVDSTNYHLFAFGEPLHAFDLDKLSPGSILIRRGRRDEKITTIDAQTRIIDSDILVIADSTRPVAIAGIMGGQDTEVTANTKNILLEAAVFNPIIIRRARQKLGMQSDSSYRFERGIDFETAESASWQAVKLIQELSGGKLAMAGGLGLTKTKKRIISLEANRVNKILGVKLPRHKTKAILSNLGFKVSPVRNTKPPRNKNKISNGVSPVRNTELLRDKDKISNGVIPKPGDKFDVKVPSFRQDVNLEIDLIEEIARIFGYGNIPKSLPAQIPQVSFPETRESVSLIKNILVGLGLNEVITYSLTDRDLIGSFKLKAGSDLIEVENPLSKEQGVLRPTLLLSIASCIAYNLNQKQDYINIFEVAKAFSYLKDVPKEELMLGIGLCGSKSFISDQGLVKQEAGFLHFKGMLEILFKKLGIKDYDFKSRNELTRVGILVNQEEIGEMVKLEKNILERLEIKNKEVFVLELSLERLFSHAKLKKNFTSLPRYPAITRDISFVLKEDLSVKQVLEKLKDKGEPLLKDIEIIDYYKGKQIPSGYRGLTISCHYCSSERTLTEAEINPLHNLLCSILKEEFGANIR